ncbi:glial cell line-derived neurotrophic factor-like isoform X1 [Megalops cyprinoides]|uniref:glial cell line-derived neurotrophic factor-like isoform X1 n=1 Tax=Megalops cyprinoides TaxID=118141 RepID=UPI0018652ED5|nr:glial cell line-derived neurotrophic factor-like isoform X1 [Megalops cyprinoides]
MKLWDVLATCFLLLSTASTNPLFQNLQSAKTSRFSEPLHDAPLLLLDKVESEPKSKSESESGSLQESSNEEKYEMTEPYPEQFEDVMEFIEATIRRLRRSPERSAGSRGRRERERQRGTANLGGGDRGRGQDRKGRGRAGGRGGGGGGGGRGGRGRNRGCVLKQVHLNVTDLGLGYQTKEELIFRYCSGPCVNSETNYDKILNNLTHNKKLEQDSPPRACCRPIAFDDDLSFLDDNLEYHTLKRHSARKCGCV